MSRWLPRTVCVNMNRSLVILLAALMVGAGIFAGSYSTTCRLCSASTQRPVDDLAWFREEFHLNDAEMAQVRLLHDGYLPECARMCTQIAAKKREISVALGDGTNVTAEVQRKLFELGELRAQCQGQMLQHFIAVSRVMPPEQGKRYLAEMQKVTLGLHEDIEKSMPETGAMHGHD